MSVDAEAQKDIPTGFRIPDHQDVIKGELGQIGDWIVANIQTDGPWPVVAQKVRWRGVDIWIIPIMKGFYPAVAMKVPPGKSRLECQELVLRFISTLSWVEEQGIMVEGGLCSGNLPHPMPRDRERGFVIQSEFDLSYFPEVTDQNAMLALGLMREGRGLNHVGFAFLSFYKILEISFPKREKRSVWISNSIVDLEGFGIEEALDGVRALGKTTPDAIRLHLYESGRCAVAHAARHPVVDPDKPSDLRRLSSELPIMRALAVKAIEEIFGVETSDTNYRKHLYELDGFKKILGPDIVAHIQDGTEPAGQPMLEIPDISIRIHRKKPYGSLEGLRCKHVSYLGNCIYMEFESARGDIAFRFMLDFAAERIKFDLFADVLVYDTGTAESADRVHEVKRFWFDCFANGQLQIVNAKTNELIGRKDAYIPLNMHANSEGVAVALAHWKMLAEERRERDRRFAEAMERNARGYDVNVTPKAGDSSPPL